MTFAACVGSPPTASMLVSPHRIGAASAPKHAKSPRAKPTPLVCAPHHAHPTRPNAPRRRSVPPPARLSPRQNRHSPRHRHPPHHAISCLGAFRPPAVGARGWARHPGGRKPCMGLWKSSGKFTTWCFSFNSISLFDLKAHFFAPTRGVQTLSRAGAVKVGRRSDISSCAWRFQATP